MPRSFPALALSALCLTTLAACGGPADAPAPEQDLRGTTSNQWLAEADDDATRFARLEYYLAGFSPSMWEAGERYAQLHEAIKRENYDLALYHWDKIRDVIERGVMKRPGRRANAEAILLDSVWPEARDAFASRDRDTAREALASVRSACMACHVAERVPFMNDQPLFTDLLP